MSKSIESIDESKDKLGAFDRLVNDTVSYIIGNMTNPKDRLKLERSMHKYAEQNTSDWMLNMTICVVQEIQKRA